MNQDLIVSAERALQAWDSTVLPRSNDGMMQERMEDLRAALTATQQAAPSQGAGDMPDTDGSFPEWRVGSFAFKRWCHQYFGPDADDGYLAEAVLQLPRRQVLPMKAADEFELHRLLAEERYTVWQLNRALRDAVEPPTFMGEPVGKAALLQASEQREQQAAVPLHMTRAMQKVIEEEDWEWADLLAAANAVTEAEYEIALNDEPAASKQEPQVVVGYVNPIEWGKHESERIVKMTRYPHPQYGYIEPVATSKPEPQAQCKKCGGNMLPGVATGQTYSAGTPDFPGDTHGVTISPGGPGYLQNCMKCEQCGWSVTVGVQAQAGGPIKGYLHLKPPFEDENGEDISGEYITLQSHREAMEKSTRREIAALRQFEREERENEVLREAIAKKDAALKACVDAKNLLLECGSPHKVSLYDEEGVEGWVWVWNHPDGREWSEMGSWDEDPPMFPPLEEAITQAEGALN